MSDRRKFKRGNESIGRSCTKIRKGTINDFSKSVWILWIHGDAPSKENQRSVFRRYPFVAPQPA